MCTCICNATEDWPCHYHKVLYINERFADFSCFLQDSLVMNLFRLIQKLKSSKKRDLGMLSFLFRTVVLSLQNFYWS